MKNFELFLNNKYLYDRNKVNLVLAIFLPGFLFLFFPVLGCILSIIVTFIVNEKKYLKVTFVYLFAFVVLIQGQRVPIALESGDWNGYIEAYKDTLKSSFFLTQRGTKDIGYTLWNYLLHPIFGESGNGFLIFTVDVAFLFWGLSAFRLWKFTGTDAKTGLCSIVLIFFFSEILLISNNLVRQQFASSIMIWAVILKFTKSKKWWFFMIWGLLTHSMTAIFLPLFILPISKKPRKKTVIYILIGCIVISSFLILAKNILLASSFYVFHNIGSADEYINSDVIDPIVIYKFAFVVLVIYFKHYFFDRNINQNVWTGINFILYITLLCFLTENMPLVVTRIYIERLPLLSLVLPYVFNKSSQYNSIYQFTIVAVFLFRFVFLSHGQYLDISNYAIMPFINLISH